MQVISTTAQLRRELAGRPGIVCVPTMGNLHDGHVALVRQARSLGATVVVTLFVNRLQFGPNEDFARYPRTFEADCARLEEAGVDVLFAPPEPELYPQPQTVLVAPPAPLADTLEGEFRPGFFKGVATVVTKLLNIVAPQAAVFGKKDYQQLLVIRTVVRQLAMPVRIESGETVRAADGLALSSRNSYLSAEERREAPRLHRVLQDTAAALNAAAADNTTGDNTIKALEAQAIQRLRDHGWKPDYVAVRNQTDLQLPPAARGQLVVLGAARLGGTRLIDNVEVTI